MKLRLANVNDAKYILKIYEPYIKNTAITFEYEVPTLEEFENRIKSISKTYPYIVCIDDNNNIVGYAYASKYKERAAFNWDVELSIYIDSMYHNKNISHALYSSLLETLKIQGVYNAYASIVVPNVKSEKFHKKYGFKQVGYYPKTGYKFKKWHDLICLEKNIINFNIEPTPIRPITSIEDRIIENIFSKYI